MIIVSDKFYESIKNKLIRITYISSDGDILISYIGIPIEILKNKHYRMNSQKNNLIRVYTVDDIINISTHQSQRRKIEILSDEEEVEFKLKYNI